MMKASTKPAPVMIMSGLTPEAEEALQSVLTDLQVYSDRLHLLGALEREQVQAVERKLKARLSPPSIDGLVAEAQHMIQRFGPALDAGRRSTQEREAAAAEAQRAGEAARAARSALLAEKARVQEEKRRVGLQQIHGEHE